MASKYTEGCLEYTQISRRKFLGASLAAAGLMLPSWMPRVAFAQGKDAATDTLVFVFLRGGADGLSVCVPYGEDDYYNLRPTIAIPAPGGGADAATDLNGFFGLPPAMSAVRGAYDDGHLLFIQASGLVDETRSHFEAQRFIELGKANDPHITTGWLARLLDNTTASPLSAPLRGLGVSYGMPVSLQGGPLSLPIPDPSQFGISGDWATVDQRLDALSALYAASDEPLRSSALNTRGAIDLMKTIDFEGYAPTNGTVYPDDEFGRTLRACAAIIKARAGVQVMALDLDGWDTHDAENPINGRMAALMNSLSGGLAAFHADVMGSGDPGVTLVAMSEFGRNVAENGNGGTDHGHGNAMIALGKAVHGGRVLTQWPGLAPEQQYEEQDLVITIDHRDVLSEILSKRLGVSNVATIFPGYSPTDRGVIA